MAYAGVRILRNNLKVLDKVTMWKWKAFKIKVKIYLISLKNFMNDLGAGSNDQHQY